MFDELFGLDGSTRNQRILIVILAILFILTLPLTIGIWLIWAIFTMLFGAFWHIFIEPIRWIMVGGKFGNGYQTLLKKYSILEIPR